MSRKIVLTGVSRGLGAAMADKFIALGHTVFGCCRSVVAAQSLAKRYPESHFRAVDVSKDEEVEAWAKQVLEQAGAPDLLLNNAAIINANAPIWEVPPAEFRQLVDININGVYYVLRHFVPAMIEVGEGVIVNFSSGWGRSASPEVGPYCASKWAIEGLTRALAQELPQAMAAIPLNPGVICTDMLQSCFGESASSYPTAEQWAEQSVPFLLDLSYADNGDPLTAPS